jgi:hypothetical protein
MKIDIGENREILLSEVYSGVGIKTDAGTFYLCQRDQGIEIHLNDGPWYSWQGPEGPKPFIGEDVPLCSKCGGLMLSVPTSDGEKQFRCLKCEPPLRSKQ